MKVHILKSIHFEDSVLETLGDLFELQNLNYFNAVCMLIQVFLAETHTHEL